MFLQPCVQLKAIKKANFLEINCQSLVLNKNKINAITIWLFVWWCL